MCRREDNNGVMAEWWAKGYDEQERGVLITEQSTMSQQNSSSYYPSTTKKIL
jgi:hypothetical protein